MKHYYTLCRGNGEQFGHRFESLEAAKRTMRGWLSSRRLYTYGPVDEYTERYDPELGSSVEYMTRDLLVYTSCRERDDDQDGAYCARIVRHPG